MKKALLLYFSYNLALASLVLKEKKLKANSKYDNLYFPITDNNLQGVLYFISPMVEMFPMKSNKLNPVGWQYITRPGEQGAFTYQLNEGENFNDIPGVFAYRFYHDKDISLKIFSQLEGGKVIFPEDDFAKIAAKIRDSKVFSQVSFDNVIGSINSNFRKDEILSLLKDKQIDIIHDSGIGFTKQQLISIQKQISDNSIFRGMQAYSRLCYRKES